MSDSLALTVLIYDWPAAHADAPGDVLAALENGDLFDDGQPICSHDRIDQLPDGRRVLHLEDHVASGGLRQLDRSGLEDALIAAGLAFELYDEPDYAYAGRIRDWRPGWETVRERYRHDGGALMTQGDLDAIRDAAGSNHTALLAALDAFFADVTAQPEPPAHTPEEVVEASGVKVTLTRSGGLDRAPIVFVDTYDELEGDSGSPGPRVRILLNDHPVYIGVEHIDAGDDVTITPSRDTERDALIGAIDAARDNLLDDRSSWEEYGIDGKVLAAELATLASEAERAEQVTIPAALVGMVAAQCDFSDTSSLDPDETARAALLPLLAGEPQTDSAPRAAAA